MTKEQQLQKIKEMEQSLAELKADYEKPEKFEFKYEKDNTYFIDTMTYSPQYSGTVLNYGRYRKYERDAMGFKYYSETLIHNAMEEMLKKPIKGRGTSVWRDNYKFIKEKLNEY